MITIKPTNFEAIVALVGGGVTQDADGIIHYDDGQTPPSESAIKTKLSELEAAYNADAYARTRQPLYPDIGDQLDDLYHEGAFSAAMTTKIKKVKDDNPKG